MCCGNGGLFSNQEPRRHEMHEGASNVTSRFSCLPWFISSLDPMRRKAGAGRGEAFRAADMIPLAVMHDRVQPAGLLGPGVEDVQRETPFEVAVEQPPVQ